MIRPVRLFAIVALALANCTDADTAMGNEPIAASAQAGNEVRPPEGAAPVVTPVAGSSSSIALTPIEQDDVELIRPQGELGCLFKSPAKVDLLTAVGDAASAKPAQGVVRINGAIVRIAAPGGFDALVDGPRFEGGGLIIAIGSMGKPVDGSEAPPVPATLTIERAGGKQRQIAGFWLCGP